MVDQMRATAQPATQAPASAPVYQPPPPPAPAPSPMSSMVETLTVMEQMFKMFKSMQPPAPATPAPGSRGAVPRPTPRLRRRSRRLPRAAHVPAASASSSS